MTNQFHRILNYMSLFIVIWAVLFGFFHTAFLQMASTNYIINGIIIGVGLFGIGLCFVLVLEYGWSCLVFVYLLICHFAFFPLD